MTQSEGASVYYPNYGWYPSNLVIECNKTYKLFSSGTTINVTGYYAHNLIYNFNYGWTWIGLSIDAPLHINDFLKDTWNNDEAIMTQFNGGNVYYDNYGWYHNSSWYLNPGVGFKVKKNAAAFHIRSINNLLNISDPSVWTVQIPTPLLTAAPNLRVLIDGMEQTSSGTFAFVNNDSLIVSVSSLSGEYIPSSIQALSEYHGQFFYRSSVQGPSGNNNYTLYFTTDNIQVYMLEEQYSWISDDQSYYEFSFMSPNFQSPPLYPSPSSPSPLSPSPSSPFPSSPSPSSPSTSSPSPNSPVPIPLFSVVINMSISVSEVSSLNASHIIHNLKSNIVHNDLVDVQVDLIQKSSINHIVPSSITLNEYIDALHLIICRNNTGCSITRLFNQNRMRYLNSVISLQVIQVISEMFGIEIDSSELANILGVPVSEVDSTPAQVESISATITANIASSFYDPINTSIIRQIFANNTGGDVNSLTVTQDVLRLTQSPPSSSVLSPSNRFLTWLVPSFTIPLGIILLFISWCLDF